MKLYIDSADVASWRLPPGTPRVAGVTTNPSLVHQAGLSVDLTGYRFLINEAAAHDFFEVMLQVPTSDAAENAKMVATLQEQAHSCKVKLTIKLPCDPRWAASIEAVRQLGLPILLTGLSNPLQLLWATEKRVQWVAPYVGRLDAAGRDVWALMRACVQAQASGPGLLAASVKSADVLAQLMGLGASAVTLRPDLIASLCTDRVTLNAIAQFEADTEASLATR